MHRTRLLTAATAAFALAAAAPAAATSPPNDDFKDAVAFNNVAQPKELYYSLSSGSTEPGEPPSGGLGDTVWFKWKNTSPGGAYVDICDGKLTRTIKVFRLKSSTVAVNNL